MPGEAETVLVLAPSGRDAELACAALATRGVASRACADLQELCAGIPENGAAIVAEEALRGGAADRLLAALLRQPPWSDFPIILLGDPQAATRRDQRLIEQANVTILERPFRMLTLVAACQAALRGRRRQYEARRAIRDRDQFLAMLGHELRNPLTAILFSLQSAAAPMSEVARERSMAVIERQSRRLSRLVDDLLDVSRITSGKVQLRRQPMDLAELVQRTAEAMAPAAADSGLRFHVDPSPEALPVDADAVRLEQVFANLLANAIKFTPAGGEVAVTMYRLGPHAVVSVRDTGIGIAPEALHRVFDLFAQLEPGLDRGRGGLGIGLTVAKSLVELHGGTIRALSGGPNQGSEFQVTLPLVSVHRFESSAEPRRRHARPKRIVLVEDNDDIRESFRMLLEEGGHEVHEAKDGVAGLDTILAKRPALAFVDIGLPSMDGYEVARRVRDRVGHTVRLIAVTGYGQPEDKERAREAGFDLHLTKPVDIQAVQRLVEDELTLASPPNP